MQTNVYDPFHPIKRALKIHSDPIMLLCPGQCIGIKADCGAIDIGCTIMLAHRPGVRTITDLDILNARTCTRLIGTTVYRRDNTRLAWAACEGEFDVNVRAVEEWGKYINTALGVYADNHDHHAPMCQYKFEGCKHPIVGGFIDATGAMGTRRDFCGPKETRNCISATVIRYYGHQGRIAGTQHWNRLLQWARGLSISLAHLISHVLDQIIEVQEDTK